MDKDPTRHLSNGRKIKGVSSAEGTKAKDKILEGLNNELGLL